MRRVLVPLDLPAAMRLPLAGGAVHALGGPTMGTSWSAKFILPPAGSLDAVKVAIERVLAGVIAEMSTWVAASAISRFNDAAPGSWFEPPADLRTVLDCALAVAADTDGAYDPTIGALVDAWGFGPPGPRDAPPDDAAIMAAAACCGFRRLQRDARGRVRQPGGLRLDLSSIAKGFAVDRVAQALERLGIADYLVEIGGELKGYGTKPDGSPWWVAIENAAACESEIVVALHGLSIATSGDAQRAFEWQGRRLSHTIDPRTGRPVSDRLAAVTVLHREAMKADVLATALTVLGPDEGMIHARARELAALFVVRGPSGAEQHMTDAFAAMLA
jgi:thiamine biosynthesis lipoprotein